MINIKVNSTPHQFHKEDALEHILKKLEIPTYGIALAVNQNIISKTHWHTTTLNDGDQVLIIKATQGG